MFLGGMGREQYDEMGEVSNVIAANGSCCC